jgi:adenine-specific DNA-methyltransferase
MSRLTDLIAQAKAKDPLLGSDLEREFKALSSRLPFGLNFERHRPEAVELPQRAVRRGDKVRVLPPRGSSQKGDSALMLVKKIDKARGQAQLVPLGADSSRGEPRRAAASRDLILSNQELSHAMT